MRSLKTLYRFSSNVVSLKGSALRSAWPRVRVYARTAAPRGGYGKEEACSLSHALARVALARETFGASLLFARLLSPRDGGEERQAEEGRGGSSLKNHRTAQVLSRARACARARLGYHRFAPRCFARDSTDRSRRTVVRRAERVSFSRSLARRLAPNRVKSAR